MADYESTHTGKQIDDAVTQVSNMLDIQSISNDFSLSNKQLGLSPSNQAILNKSNNTPTFNAIGDGLEIQQNGTQRILRNTRTGGGGLYLHHVVGQATVTGSQLTYEFDCEIVSTSSGSYWNEYSQEQGARNLAYDVSHMCNVNGLIVNTVSSGGTIVTSTWFIVWFNEVGNNFVGAGLRGGNTSGSQMVDFQVIKISADAVSAL